MRKAFRIGLIGTLNGLRMREWYGSALAERLGASDIVKLSRDRGIPVVEIPRFGDADAQRTVRSLDVDLAVSMGNGYIPRSFFEIPRLGMINVHHELLPEFRGAQSVLWPLYHGSSVTGYSVHEINERIDAGRILLRREVPIRFRPTLRETVIETSAIVQELSVAGLFEVLADLDRYRAAAQPNRGGRSYTTPDVRALIRIYRNFLTLRRRALDPALPHA